MTILEVLSGQFPSGIVFDGADPSQAGHLKDFKYSTPADAMPGAIAIPRTVAQLASILRICNERGVPVTAQGGMTGLVGGALASRGGVALSLERLRGVIELDTDAATMTVWAGTPLEEVQRAAGDAGFLFPLDIGARGSASIGGNAATNAGGNRVLRYGMMRDLVLGMEVVLANGTVVCALNKMLKNNAGYDLKHLFMGSEGTLGIITKLVLKLVAKPNSTCTAFCAAGSYQDALVLLARLRTGLGGTLSAFEVMWPSYYEMAARILPRLPLPDGYPVYVLLDALGSDQEQDQARFESVLAEMLESGVVADAVVAQSGKESDALWAVRDCNAEFARLFGPRASYDISIPTGRIESFIEECTRRLAGAIENSRTIWFGHVADANIHLMTNFDGASEKTTDDVVYAAVHEWGGSISAEHGIGTSRKAYLGLSRTPEEIGVMHLLKQALDPNNILNPGKVLPA